MHGPSLRPTRHQRGSMAVAMMLMLLGLITILGIVEVGYLYWAKRDAQKVADLAALSGAQQLPDCTAATSAASNNAANDNKFSGTLDTNACGTWDPSSSGSKDHFTAGTTNANAVKVIAQRPVPSIWGFAGALPNVSAEAVAAQQSPIAAFSVGTKLVEADGESTLGQLLKGIGIPLDDTSLVGYDGLADVNITPAGLLKQLGIPVDAGITVGGLNALLAEQKDITVGQLLDAIVTVAGRQDLVNANASLLNAILADAQVPGIALNDVTLGGPGGLFAEIVAPAGAAQAALNAQVNALQLLATAIGVGTGKHAIEILDPTVKLGNFLQLTAATSVIEPPSIGVGGQGTTAYTSQIRAFLHIFVDTNGVPLVGDLLGSITGTRIKLDLPVAIDLVGAKGTLGDLCSETDDQGRQLAPIHVDSSVLKACVGNITADNAFSTVTSCDQIPGANENKDLLSVNLIGGVSLLDLNTHFTTTALPASDDVSLYTGQTASVGNSLEIGTTVTNLFTALTTALIANPDAQQPGPTDPDKLATDLWNSTDTSKGNIARVQQALDQLQNSSLGLQGLLDNEAGQVADILGNTLTLNVPGILGGVDGLLGGITNALSGILNGLTCTLGSTNSCINLISDAMPKSSGTYSNAFLGLLGLVVQTLQGPLDQVGSNVLAPLLQNVLGVDLGKTDVHLQSLQCHRVQLVY